MGCTNALYASMRHLLVAVIAILVTCVAAGKKDDCNKWTFVAPFYHNRAARRTTTTTALSEPPSSPTKGCPLVDYVYMLHLSDNGGSGMVSNPVLMVSSKDNGSCHIRVVEDRATRDYMEIVLLEKSLIVIFLQT
jgi:hypothetical protein